MREKLPDTYESYKKFVNDNVFGEGEEEVVHPNEQEQREFMEKFSADVEEEKGQQKGKQRAGEWVSPASDNGQAGDETD